MSWQLLLGLVLFSKETFGISFNKIRNVTIQEGKPITLTNNQTDVIFLDLRGILYKNSLSELKNVVDLGLDFEHFEKIEPGAICVSSNLKEVALWIKSERIVTLKKDIFKNCENLYKLYIRGESETHLDDGIFDSTTNLRQLTLQSVTLERISKTLLNKLKFLESLTLKSCSIKEFDPDAFENLKKLKHLQIDNNKDLQTLPPQLLRNLNSLTSFYLDTNNLTNLTWNEFTGLTSLEHLDIRYNNILDFNAEKIAENMPQLKVFIFQTIPLNCERKRMFEKELKSKYKHNVDVVHTYHPEDYDPCKYN